MNGKPFYLAIYEKYDLMLKKGLVRIRKITKYRPYPEQDSMVFHVYPGGDGLFLLGISSQKSNDEYFNESRTI